MKKNLYQTLGGALAHIVFPRAKVKSETTLNPDEPAVYICNHSGAIGPALMTLDFKIPHKTWMISYVLDKDRNKNFIFHDFFFGKSKKHPKFWRMLAFIVAKLLRPLLFLSDPIPVYHDRRMFNTFKESTDTLLSGKSLVIFAECPERFSEYVNELYSGFVDIARSYYSATGKNLKFYPVYAEKSNKVISVGKPIEYTKEIPIQEIREKITSYLRDGIDRLARNLPEHKPVPFLPEAWYQYYGEYEHNPMEYWKTFE